MQHLSLSVLVLSVKLADHGLRLVRVDMEEMIGVRSGGEVKQAERGFEVSEVDVQFHIGLFDVSVVRESHTDL